MKIAIPTDDMLGMGGKVSEHFGRCPTFTFVNENGEVLETIENNSRHTGGGAILPPELMKKHGADILICKGLGSKAIALCEELGIGVYIFGEAGTVGGMLKAWKENRAVRAGEGDACKEENE